MENTPCPVCNKMIHINEIEHHVNNCLFLNSSYDNDLNKKRKDNTISPRQKKSIKWSNASNNKNKASEVENKNNLSSVSIQSNPYSLSRHSNLNQKTTETIEEKKEYSFDIPLAEALRPSSLNDFVGQEKIIGDNTVLRKLLDNADVPSLILWGPPGCGKTTLANVIKDMLLQHSKQRDNKSVRFVKLYATMAGVGDVKDVINVAKNELRMFQKRTVLFMDEIHRFNKAQQDTFLPHIENGTITLIGATTENPSFSLNNALLSRCRVIVLEKLHAENITKILHRAVDYVGGYVIINEDDTCNKMNAKWRIDLATIQWLAEISDGDARIALNSLQMSIQSKKNSDINISLKDIQDSIKKSHILYDKKGDEHYNLISALHKSIRASHDSASLYWLARMLEGGEDPIYIARRLVRAASEDIGLAEPNALVLAVSTLQGCQSIGMPECDVLLAQLTVFLARCPKSREMDNAMSKAKSFVTSHKGALPSVPLHLRNAPTKLMKTLGYGHQYNMKHKTESGLEYMPEGFEHVTFFNEDD
ncbi:hypothetical protein PGB90_004621 [Kerria lacca]